MNVLREQLTTLGETDVDLLDEPQKQIYMQKKAQLEEVLFSMGAASTKRPGDLPEEKSTTETLRDIPRLVLWQLLYLITINLFGLFVRLRFIYRAILYRVQALMTHHHYTPAIIQRDVGGLNKIPNHLTVILPSPPLYKRRRTTTNSSGSGNRLRADSTTIIHEQLLHDVGELTAWCASAGISTLSIYEKTGILKSAIPGTHATITEKLKKYFPPSSIPHLNLRVPNVPSYSPPASSHASPRVRETEHLDQFSLGATQNINVLLISAEDGRETIVDLTKTLTAMVQKGKLVPQDISTELIDSELSESIMDEPDLLICFTEEYHLDGYPPWHIRLTELFHLPDHTSGVTYNAFIQGLQMYNNSSMRFGK